VKHRAGGDHLGIDQRTAREQAVEETAMPIRPLHHRGDADFSIYILHFVRIFVTAATALE
jgi:hypothetical protein